MSRIGILVHYKVKPGSRDAVVAAARAHIGRVKENEPGCLQFDLLIPKDSDDDVRLFEMYKNKDAFKNHTQMPYMTIVGEEMKPHLDDRIITICDMPDD